MKIRCLKRKTDNARKQVARRHTARKKFAEVFFRDVFERSQRKGFARRYFEILEKEKQQASK